MPAIPAFVFRSRRFLHCGIVRNVCYDRPQQDTFPNTTSTQTDTMDVMPSIYQLAGLDDLGRGFNRQVNITVIQEAFHATFRYERLLLETEPHATEHAALASLIARLQARGYTQLRSRIQFRDTAYLGNQETWEDHQDAMTTGILTKLQQAFHTLFRRSRRIA